MGSSPGTPSALQICQLLCNRLLTITFGFHRRQPLPKLDVLRFCAAISMVSGVGKVGKSSWARPVNAGWALAQSSRACRAIFQWFLLSLNACKFFVSIARVMVRLLTFTRWAACVGDMGAEVCIWVGMARYSRGRFLQRSVNTFSMFPASSLI